MAANDLMHEVIIARSASETVVLRVNAITMELAEEKVNDILGQSHLVTLDEIKERGIEIVSVDCNGDEESTWEII